MTVPLACSTVAAHETRTRRNREIVAVTRKPQHEGICYLAGAGPGDLGLVTLKVKEVVERADVLVYDYLCNPEILGWAPAGAEIIYAGKKAVSTR